MGELIRRLDYQRRTKKSLSVDTGSGQRINKEHSPQVRAANEMAVRKKDLYVKSMEKHKKLFLDRFNYDRKVICRFKTDLDAKSADFNECKFQQLRVQSSKGRLQGNQEADIGPVTEIVPRQYYRDEGKSSVKFKFNMDSDEIDSDSEESEDEAFLDKSKTLEQQKHFIKTLNSWTNITKKPPSGVLRRRKMSLANFESHRFIPARDVRRKSAPPKVMAALQPRDVRSAPVGSRRSSRSSLGSASSNENIEEDKEMDKSGRSFRLLREAFKKKKIETPNPQQDKLNVIRADHRQKSADLLEKTMEKFDKLFSDQVFLVY
ncbi:uncharacterized protein LOC132722478 [Ruditapes philippinarum]|uniref:uncharacterized protein LOC132722478 n=1 Tax=Ruditapes philippinarum TaxID=129788 RepID=UPI00295B82CD|nr:uncharacterized protein LOC132722478 [Ruditapes philippinarum]